MECDEVILFRLPGTIDLDNCVIELAFKNSIEVSKKFELDRITYYRNQKYTKDEFSLVFSICLLIINIIILITIICLSFYNNGFKIPSLKYEQKLVILIFCG